MHTKREGTGERASEFLRRLATHPGLHPQDRRRAERVAELFISLGDHIESLREENRRLVAEINDPAAAKTEIPF